MTRLTSAALLLLLGCAPGEVIPDGETETDSAPAETCSNPITIEVSPSGRTWSTCAEWTAWAETTTPERVADLVPAESPDGASCYADLDALVCTTDVGPLLLLGRPLDIVELVPDPAPCVGLQGPWVSVAWNGLTCLGVFELPDWPWVAVEIY